MAPALCGAAVLHTPSRHPLITVSVDGIPGNQKLQWRPRWWSLAPLVSEYVPRGNTDQGKPEASVW